MTRKRAANDIVNRLMSRGTGDGALAASEIMRLRFGVEDVVMALKSGKSPDLCAWRLEVVLGKKSSVVRPPRRRSPGKT